MGNDDMCQLGGLQSPINIQARNTQQCETDQCQLSFNYNPTTHLKIVRNRSLPSLVVIPDSGQSYVTYKNTVYELQSISFYRPALHKLNSRPIDGASMEIVLNHQSNDKMLCIGVPIRKGGTGPGSSRAYPFFKELTTLLDSMGQGAMELNESVPMSIMNPWSILPRNMAFYEYTGSTVQPPCSEGVTWIVMENSVRISSSHYTSIKAAIFNQINSRQLQRTNGRSITYNANSNPSNNRNLAGETKCYNEDELQDVCQCMCNENKFGSFTTSVATGNVLLILFVVIMFAMCIYLAFANDLFKGLRDWAKGPKGNFIIKKFAPSTKSTGKK